MNDTTAKWCLTGEILVRPIVAESSLHLRFGINPNRSAKLGGDGNSALEQPKGVH